MCDTETRNRPQPQRYPHYQRAPVFCWSSLSITVHENSEESSLNQQEMGWARGSRFLSTQFTSLLPTRKKKWEESHLCRENNSGLEQNAVNLHITKADSSGSYQETNPPSLGVVAAALRAQGGGRWAQPVHPFSSRHHSDCCIQSGN